MDTVSGAREPSRVLRVTGPLVEIGHVPGMAMHDVVSLGEAALLAEIVEIRGEVATAQAYEYTGGLRPGDRAATHGGPLSAPLGPHLLGGVFDGLLRPLGDVGVWLAPGRTGDGRNDRSWAFSPSVADGESVAAGEPVGEVLTAGSVAVRVLAPPGTSGPVTRIVPPGSYTGAQIVAEVAGTAIRIDTAWPIRRPRPIQERRRLGEPLTTGQRAIDLLFPIARGGTVAVPGGFGTGKTMLLQQIAKWCDADVIVYVGCGERGNEMSEVIAELATLEDPRTGGHLADRTVVIANTSNMPMMAREASVHAGAAVAEYFRDMGLDTVVIADSTSRWAEALREFASRSGELPAEEGYPANLASAIAGFYERAGAVTTLGGTAGSVTVIGAVSPPGGDFTEPVTAHTERFVRCLWTLDRDLAYARHYPALSWAGSFSRDAGLQGIGDAQWSWRRADVASVLSEADRLADLVDLIGITALPPRERIGVLAGRLVREGVLQQNALSANDAYCDAGKTAALVDAVLAVVAVCRELVEAEVSPSAVEEIDFSPLVRAREEVPNGDTAGIDARRDTVLGRLTALAGSPGHAPSGPDEPGEGGPP
ncbi:V-type ATP synthase subunit A [Embleya sp. NBC_00896]|uniref:V-type ATP synthase subunit A n=1 Tax=Embleya sp. NBC_00896 TaxID=2975961 RepID=UPI002F906849|nr:V-type ATP synthase subunit A [Embleya sp. NBC_00896]